MYTLKQKALENILGKMDDMVGHAIIPFDVGGTVDMYRFPQKVGTAFATMELIDENGAGPKRSTIGTYELIAFTKEEINNQPEKSNFSAIEQRICGLFTTIGYYSKESVIKPFETAEIPDEDGSKFCLIFDEYPTNGKFNYDNKKHGLLLVIEIFESEMNYAMQNNGKALIDLLKKSGYYPYSDLDREKVI